MTESRDQAWELAGLLLFFCLAAVSLTPWIFGPDVGLATIAIALPVVLPMFGAVFWRVLHGRWAP